MVNTLNTTEHCDRRFLRSLRLPVEMLVSRGQNHHQRERGANMLQTTANAVREMFRADPSISTPERNRLLALLRNGGEAKPTEPKPPRIMKRAEVARMLARSTRAVDLLARSGALPRVTLPGRTRSAGFREADVLALINAKGGAA